MTEPKFSNDTMNIQPTNLKEMFARIESSGNADAELIECGVVICGYTIWVYPSTVDINELGIGYLKPKSAIATMSTSMGIRGIQKCDNMKYNPSTNEIFFSDGRKLNT